MAPGAGPAATSGTGGAAGDSANPEGVPVYLLTTVNGNASPDLVQMTDSKGHLFISRESARQLGFSEAYLSTIPPGTPLDAYPGVKANYDAGMQSVAITAPFSDLTLSTEVLGTGLHEKTHASASPGLLFNYDLYATDTPSQATVVSGFTELRAFSNLGVASTHYLTQELKNAGEPWTRTTVRLDSDLEHSFQDQQITLRLGDTITRGLPWTRQTRIGGFQIGRDFSLQPYQTTTPLPAYFGTAALPSSVQLYINGIQQYSGNTPAGPFNLYFQPSVNGAGQAQVVMTDALGRSTVVNFPFYATSTLLREGLTDWSFEAGYVRQNYGYESFDYGQEPMASGIWRYGLTRAVTLEGHAEGSRGVAMGGLGATIALGTWGTVSGSWAASRASGYTPPIETPLLLADSDTLSAGPARGSQFSLGYQLQRGQFSMGASTQQATEGFRDVASQYGSTPILRSDNAYASVTIAPLGNFGATYVSLRQAGESATRYGGLSWSRNLGRRATVGVSFNQNLDQRSDRMVTLNLTFNLDHGISTYASVTRSQDTLSSTVAASGYTDPNGEGWNWNVRGQQTSPSGDAGGSSVTSGSGQISRRTQYADINMGVNAIGNTSNAFAGASGSVIAMGDGIFASRRIDDAFAVVSTEGIPHIPVRSENRLVGETDSRGLLLVPSLLSYQNNRISIDPTNLPLDTHIDQVKQTAVPRRDSGVNVVFGVRHVQAASVTLHQPNGKAVPLGVPVYLNGSQQSVGWTGYDGQIYLEGLTTENTIVLKDDHYECKAHFAFKAVPGTLPEIGPLACTP